MLAPFFSPSVDRPQECGKECSGECSPFQRQARLASDAYNVIILAQSALMGGCSVGSLGCIIRSPNIPVIPSDELSFWASTAHHCTAYLTTGAALAANKG
ncbi:hypothetical protein V2G26_017841 [Clonostachys chloroleuca]